MSNAAAEGAPRGTYEAVLPNQDTHASAQNKYSAVITQRRTQGAGQAQLYATDVGKVPDGMNKPQVGIASVWYEGNPCNMHLLDVALAAKEEIERDAIHVGAKYNMLIQTSKTADDLKYRSVAYPSRSRAYPYPEEETKM